MTDEADSSVVLAELHGVLAVMSAKGLRVDTILEMLFHAVKQTGSHKNCPPFQE